MSAFKRAVDTDSFSVYTLQYEDEHTHSCGNNLRKMPTANTTQCFFLIGCILFTADGLMYVYECTRVPTSECILHSGFYTSGSLLFLLGTVRWLVDT